MNLLKNAFFALLLGVASLGALAQDKVVYHFDSGIAQATKGLRNIRNHLDVDPKAQIVAVEAGGDHQTLWLDAEGGRIAVKSEPEWPARIGETVPLGLHLHNACWFASEGEGLLL